MVGRARLYSRAVCGLLEKRAICPPLEAERNFERRERGGGGRERERVSPSNFLTRASCALRVSNVQFLVSMESFSFTVYIGSTQIENFESKFLSD